MQETKRDGETRLTESEGRVENDIMLIDFAVTLAKQKKTIIAASVIAGLVAAAVTFFLPDIYTADTQIFPPQQQSSVSSMLNQLGTLGGLVGGSSGMGIKNPNDTYVAMLNSRRLRDSLIKRFKLGVVYKTKTPAATRQALLKATTIKARKDGFIVVQVDDENPQRAAALANGYIEELQQLTQVFAVTEASQRRLFYEKQLLRAKQNLSDTEIALKQLQEKTGLIQLEGQAAAAISALASLKGQIAMAEVKLGAMRTFATSENPEYIQLNERVIAMHAQLSKIEAGSIATSKVPEAGLEYLRKFRDVKYAQAVFEMLAKQFELAKIDEAKESSVIQVLDRAEAPEHNAKPKRKMIVLLAAITAGFLAILWAFITEALQNAKKDSESQAQLQALKKHLRWN
jgi:tyrosine-protein kinase Etk/Wzc